jgi:hypothetical protein
MRAQGTLTRNCALDVVGGSATVDNRGLFVDGTMTSESDSSSSTSASSPLRTVWRPARAAELEVPAIANMGNNAMWKANPFPRLQNNNKCKRWQTHVLVAIRFGPQVQLHLVAPQIDGVRKPLVLCGRFRLI